MAAPDPDRTPAPPAAPTAAPAAAHPPPLIAGLQQGLRRRIVYLLLCEAGALLASTAGLAAGADSGLERAGVAGLVSSVVAVSWNWLYNALFERWEARQAVRGRGVARRVAHTLGFEAGLVLLLVPFFAWWLGITLWHALVLDLGLLLFFLFYTYGFNWAFDRVFGLPASAQAPR